MAITRIRITDDGGTITTTIAVLLKGSPFAILSLGDVQIKVAGAGRQAAERCRAISVALERVAYELLRSAPRTITDERPGDELQGSAASAAISVALDRPRQALDARAHAGEGEDAALEAGAWEDDGGKA